MTDPEAAKENEETEVPPPQPPRPAPGASGLSQLESDEQYARQLAEHYERSGSFGGARQSRPYARTRDPGPGETNLKPNELYDREHSFLDDDLPVIRDNLRKGFHETQTKVNSWITNFKKRIDDALEEDEEAQQQDLAYGRRPGEPSSRRSGDYERYDADPQVITDDFAGMKLAPDGSKLSPSLFHLFLFTRACAVHNPLRPLRLTGSDTAPIRDNRPPANSDVFRPPPPSKSPRPNDGRRVAFKESTEDIDAYNSSPKTGAQRSATPPGNKQSKWQPLSSVDPNPIADNDPFSLGDSEDERDVKDKTAGQGKGEEGGEDAERMRKAAAEAMSDSLVEGKQGEAGSKS